MSCNSKCNLMLPGMHHFSQPAPVSTVQKHLHRLELSAPFRPDSHSQGWNDVACKGRKGISDTST